MVEIKIRSHPSFLQQFIRSTLPFDHYYVYGDRLYRKGKHKWQMENLESLRIKLREEFQSVMNGADVDDPDDVEEVLTADDVIHEEI